MAQLLDRPIVPQNIIIWILLHRIIRAVAERPARFERRPTHEQRAAALAGCLPEARSEWI